MRRRFLGLNFIQCVYIDYITCTFIILYGQECLNHGGSNSIQGGNRKFLGCTQWSSIELEICWKYVLYEYRVTPSLLNSILSASGLLVDMEWPKRLTGKRKRTAGFKLVGKVIKWGRAEWKGERYQERGKRWLGLSWWGRNPSEEEWKGNIQ